MKECVLYDHPCNECGECERCDLDPNKICDNCMRCVKSDAEYRGIMIDEIQAPKDEKKSKLS